MVAPTRTPQARGVKCDLCKKILSLATWLDQTKLAKEVEEAQNVINLIKNHQKTECPCIPKNIENLLVGSTHFEIHRLVAKKLDHQIHKRQYEYFIEAKLKVRNDSTRERSDIIINDCHTTRGSRFKIYVGYNDQQHTEKSLQQLRHLRRAIDYWRTAMEDQINPFNSKLALRLGLTHHVIYACYLFKYYKLLDYQLISANLLLNLFKSIDGVTANALLHANYLLIKSLVDCNQLQLARHYLKQAIKSPSYQDKSNYESILLNCAECELKMLEADNIYGNLEDLAELTMIKPDDKLQHYYARTLAMSLIIKYVQYFPSRSDQCFEFYHCYRYICAMIRRCYEESFELVLAEKDATIKQHGKASEVKQAQILDHSWIRFAVCDFVFTTFDLLLGFYSRAGLPEVLELLYNGLNLVTFRTASCYWQARMIAIGVQLDLLCDKYDLAKAKLDVLARIYGGTNDQYLMNLLRLESEISSLAIFSQEKSVINKDVILDFLTRVKSCRLNLLGSLSRIELSDCKSDSNSKTSINPEMESDYLIFGGCLGKLSLRILNIGISSLMLNSQRAEAMDLMKPLSEQLKANDSYKILEFQESQLLLESLILFADIHRSDELLLESAGSSSIFLKLEDKISDLQSQLSVLTLNNGIYNGDQDGASNRPRRRRKEPDNANLTSTTTTTNKVTRLAVSRRTRRKGTYEVAARSEQDASDENALRLFDIIGTVTNLDSMSKEELVISYLRNSEPNPDYMLYRRAHEIMMCFRMSDDETQQINHDQLLYHFSESTTAQTMRYRWMMFEEPHNSHYEPPKVGPRGETIPANPIKNLGFCNSMLNHHKTMRHMLRTIPDDYKLVQLKYIHDKINKEDHLIGCSFDGSSDPVFFHTKRPIDVSDDFFENAKVALEGNHEEFNLPNKFASKVEEGRRTLLNSNQKSRSERRQQLETDLGVMLHDLEDDLLGPFRFLMSGKIINDTHYSKFVANLIDELNSIMRGRTCLSIAALRGLIENAPLVSRDEFCQVISMLFRCSSSSVETRDCFNKWLKSIESYLGGQKGLSKSAYVQSLPRGQLGLILDRNLELIPLESIPVARITKQAMFRVPSLRLFSILAGRYCSPLKLDPNRVAYMLDPANNLSKTRERFQNKLRSKTGWCGTIGQAPRDAELERWLLERQVYLFIGHGAGTAYYNRLCNGRGVSAMGHVGAASIVMGCSSGRVLAEGPRLETFGINWVFVLRGAPCYVGLLWDVTDTDIDRYLDCLLSRWLPANQWPFDEPQTICSPPSGKLNKSTLSNGGGGDNFTSRSIANASAQARHVCQLKFLVGSTPVVYGLPAWCKPSRAGLELINDLNC